MKIQGEVVSYGLTRPESSRLGLPAAGVRRLARNVPL
jgi:hypothetical protein